MRRLGVPLQQANFSLIHAPIYEYEQPPQDMQGDQLMRGDSHAVHRDTEVRDADVQHVCSPSFGSISLQLPPWQIPLLVPILTLLPA